MRYHHRARARDGVGRAARAPRGARAGLPRRPARLRVRARVLRRHRRPRRLRSRLHPGRSLPDHPRTALRAIRARSERMKIVVAIKQVPDTATQVKIAGGNQTLIDTAGITWILSPYDEFAIEEALRIKEKRGQGEVIAVSLGPDRAKEALRSCLAMGADRAIHVNDPTFADTDTLTTARALAAVVKQEQPALVLVGRQAIDDDMGAVGAQLAEVLGWPCAYWIMEETIDADGKTVKAARQVEGGLEVFDVPLPAVLAAQKG